VGLDGKSEASVSIESTMDVLNSCDPCLLDSIDRQANRPIADQDGQEEAIAHASDSVAPELLNSELLLQDQLKLLRQQQNWAAIYELLNPFYETKPWFQQQHRLLSNLGYACLRLSEAKFPVDPIARSQARRQRTCYQAKARRIFERCIALDASNAFHLSRLGLIYYRQAIEQHQHCRQKDCRQEDYRQEGWIAAEQAVKYLDQAIVIGGARVKDLHRKGHLLTKILGNPFVPCPDLDRQSHSNRLRSNRQLGILTLQQATQRWESLRETIPAEATEKRSSHFEYIQAYYQLGLTYLDQVPDPWSPEVFALKLRIEDPGMTGAAYIPAHLDGLAKACHAFFQCFYYDRPFASLQDDTNQNWVSHHLQAVDKLYALGKVEFAQYCLLSGYCQKDNPKADQRRTIAQKHLEQALTTDWQPDRPPASKIHIAERLARLYISQGEYQGAIDLIRNYGETVLSETGLSETGLQNPSSERHHYILYTLALALLLDQQYTAAEQLLHPLTAATSSSPSSHIWKAYFLRACIAWQQHQWIAAEQWIDRAEPHMKRDHDILLILRGLISEQQGAIDRYRQYLREAQQIQAYRVVVNALLAAEDAVA
jgi:hypothetical protein